MSSTQRNEPSDDEYWKITVYDIKMKDFPSKTTMFLKWLEIMIQTISPTVRPPSILVGSRTTGYSFEKCQGSSLSTKSIDLDEGKIVELGEGKDFDK